MSAGFEFVVQNDHPTSSLHFYVDNNWTCLDVEFIEPAGFTDRTPFDIAAGGGYSFKLYRLDGHGCDGKQGTFQTTAIDVNGISLDIQFRMHLTGAETCSIEGLLGLSRLGP